MAAKTKARWGQVSDALRAVQRYRSSILPIPPVHMPCRDGRVAVGNKYPSASLGRLGFWNACHARASFSLHLFSASAHIPSLSLPPHRWHPTPDPRPFPPVVLCSPILPTFTLLLQLPSGCRFAPFSPRQYQKCMIVRRASSTPLNETNTTTVTTHATSAASSIHQHLEGLNP